MYKFTKKVFEKANAILIDVKDKEVFLTRMLARNGSRYNEYYVQLVVTLLKMLLSESTELMRKKQIDRMPSVTILTGYTAQKAKYLSCLQAMEVDGLEISSVECETFDGAQGKEFDLALVDLLITGHCWVSGRAS